MAHKSKSTIMTKKTVRGLARGLYVLETLGELRFASVAALASRTGLPRATIYRLLETLQEAGYVQRTENSGYFQLTAALPRIARGFDLDVKVTGLAAEALTELNKAVVWPVDFATFDNDAMVVRLSTQNRSPKSILEHPSVGLRLPMSSSCGLAYLAHLPPPECETILARCLAAEDGPPHWTPSRISQKLGGVRACGYAVRVGGGEDPKTSSLAVPVLFRGRPAGSLTIMFIRSAGPIEQMVAENLDILRRTAKKIEAALARLADKDPQNS